MSKEIFLSNINTNNNVRLFLLETKFTRKLGNSVYSLLGNMSSDLPKLELCTPDEIICLFEKSRNVLSVICCWCGNKKYMWFQPLYLSSVSGKAKWLWRLQKSSKKQISQRLRRKPKWSARSTTNGSSFARTPTQQKCYVLWQIGYTERVRLTTVWQLLSTHVNCCLWSVEQHELIALPQDRVTLLVTTPRKLNCGTEVNRFWMQLVL